MLLERGTGSWRDNTRHVAFSFCWIHETRVGGLRVLPDGGPGVVMVRLARMELGLTDQAQDTAANVPVRVPVLGLGPSMFPIACVMYSALRRKRALVRT